MEKGQKDTMSISMPFEFKVPIYHTRASCFCDYTVYTFFSKNNNIMRA